MRVGKWLVQSAPRRVYRRGLAVLEVAQHAVAVELDLVEPAVAFGRRRHQRGELGLDALGEGAGASLGQGGRVEGGAAALVPGPASAVRRPGSSAPALPLCRPSTPPRGSPLRLAAPSPGCVSPASVHTASESAAICSSERPVLALSGACLVIAASSPVRASSSRSLKRSQFSFWSSSPGLGLMRTSIQPPRSFVPSRRNFRCPSRYAAPGSSLLSRSGYQRPMSHTITVPPPYSPFGMMPSNSA